MTIPWGTYDDFFRRAREQARQRSATSHDAPSLVTVYTERSLTIRYAEPKDGQGHPGNKHPSWGAANEWQESTDRSLDVPAEEPWRVTIGPARPVTVADHVSDITRAVAAKLKIPPEILKAHMEGREP